MGSRWKLVMGYLRLNKFKRRMSLKLCRLKNMGAFYFPWQRNRLWTVGWLKTVFKGREHEGKARKNTTWLTTCQPVHRVPCAAGCLLQSTACVNLSFWEKKILPFAYINILLVNLNDVTSESSFDGERKRQASLINLFSKYCCGGFLPLLSPLWQPQLHTGKRLMQQYARSLFSFEVTALISSVSNF